MPWPRSPSWVAYILSGRRAAPGVPAAQAAVACIAVSALVLTPAGIAVGGFPFDDATAVLTIVVCAAHAAFVLENDILKTKRTESKYVKVTDYLQKSLPSNAIFICHQYSGSIRYYTDRRILRYDWLVPNRLEDAVAKLEALGYKPYILLEQWEEPIFKGRFSASTPLGTLDWRPSVDLLDTRVRIYDPSMR